MAIKPKPGAGIKRPAPKPAPKAETVEVDTVEMVSSRTVTLSRDFTIQTADGQWAKAGVAVSGSIDEIDEIREQVSELATAEIAASVDQIKEFAWDGVGGDFTSDAADEGDEGADEDPDAIMADDEEPTPEAVRAMSRDEVSEFITAYELDTDPDAFKKNPAGLKNLREAVIAEAFTDTTADDGEEATDDDDGAEGGDEGDEVAIDEETINSMARPALVKLVKDNEIDVDPDKYPKLTALRAAIIEALTPDDDDDAGDDGDDDDNAGDEGDDAEADAELYDRPTLSAMSTEDLKAIYVEWEMGKYPAGPAPVAKKAAITAILKAQEG